LNIVYFLLGISPASNCSRPTFRNPVSVPSSRAGCTVHSALEDGTDTGFRNVGLLQFDTGEIPRRKYTTLYIRLTEHFNTNKLLVRNEFGFRKGIATEDAIFKLTNEILNAFNNKTMTGSNFL